MTPYIHSYYGRSEMYMYTYSRPGLLFYNTYRYMTMQAYWPTLLTYSIIENNAMMRLWSSMVFDSLLSMHLTSLTAVACSHNETNISRSRVSLEHRHVHELTPQYGATQKAPQHVHHCWRQVTWLDKSQSIQALCFELLTKMITCVGKVHANDNDCNVAPRY